MGTLSDIVELVIRKRKPEIFKFVEIGVFKGDNALRIIQYLMSRGYRKDSIFYMGFDIFEDIGDYREEFPKDFGLYDLPEYPYWEYSTGLHSYENVFNKLNAVLNQNNFRLFKGDSREQVAKHMDVLSDVSLVYIDACHDYEAVKSDWTNVKNIMSDNPDMVVVFDDATYDGVKQVRSEISLDSNYLIRDVNFNQFSLVSDKSCYSR